MRERTQEETLAARTIVQAQTILGNPCTLDEVFLAQDLAVRLHKLLNTNKALSTPTTRVMNDPSNPLALGSLVAIARMASTLDACVSDEQRAAVTLDNFVGLLAALTPSRARALSKLH